MANVKISFQPTYFLYYNEIDYGSGFYYTEATGFKTRKAFSLVARYNVLFVGFEKSWGTMQLNNYDYYTDQSTPFEMKTGRFDWIIGLTF